MAKCPFFQTYISPPETRNESKKSQNLISVYLFCYFFQKFRRKGAIFSKIFKNFSQNSPIGGHDFLFQILCFGLLFTKLNKSPKKGPNNDSFHYSFFEKTDISPHGNGQFATWKLSGNCSLLNALIFKRTFYHGPAFCCL